MFQVLNPHDSAVPKEEQEIFPRAIELVLAKHLPPDGQPAVLGTECRVL